MMISSANANTLADEMVAQYATDCGVQSPEDIRNALEMLISKAARGIEKYCGNQAAIDVLGRTTRHVASFPAEKLRKPS